MVKSEKKEEKKQYAEFTTRTSSAVLHFHVMGYPLGSWVPPPLIQTQVEGWLKTPCYKLLAKWSNQQGIRIIWGSCNPLEIGDWVISLYAFPMALDIPGAQSTNLSQMPVSIQLYASLIWNPILPSLPVLTTKDQITRWRAWRIHTCSHSPVETAARRQCVRLPQRRLEETPIIWKSFWGF